MCDWQDTINIQIFGHLSLSLRGLFAPIFLPFWCTFNYGPKCRFVWLQIWIFLPQRCGFSLPQRWWLWAAGIVGCAITQSSPSGSRPRRPRGCAKAPDRPQMLSQCHKTPPAAKSQSQTETKIPSFRSSTPFVASFDSEPMSFFCSEDHAACCPLDMASWDGEER